MIDMNSLLYDVFMKPLELRGLSKKRKNLISQAYGDILEIGTGTGVNFKFYNYNAISSLTLFDLSLSEKVKGYPFPNNITLNYIEGNVEELPFSSDTFDSVVFTLVFCSVSDPFKGLKEVYRILKPGGKIYFIEHVLSDNCHYSHVMNKVNPVWHKVSKGCNLNRDTLSTIKKANFKIQTYDKFWKGIFISGIGKKQLTSYK